MWYGLTGTRTEMTGSKSIKLRIEEASLHLSIFLSAPGTTKILVHSSDSIREIDAKGVRTGVVPTIGRFFGKIEYYNDPWHACR